MHIPRHPKDFEKYLYIAHGQRLLTFFSIIGFSGVLVSSYRFFSTDKILYIFFPFLAFTFFYYLVSVFVQGFGGSFDPATHHDIVEEWRPVVYPSVDIFLPVAGEDLRILDNTWRGVDALRKHYRGNAVVYVLDDADDSTTKELAKKHEFNYLVRDDRGHFKKAGNLRHGFINSNNEFIVILDADFRPRYDFLDELLPYFYKDPKLGIVQSPQYFDVHKKQNWIERGAGAVQEYFYRSIQQNRQAHDGAICVGSNAVYRRKALASNGGTTLIEHSEDVHTGFDLRKKGWGLLYLPIVLAKGVCPNDLRGFFRQQYRWCKGSMSLLTSKKFWQTRLALPSRLCYITGFLYYIHTGILSIIAPLIPLALVYLVPEQANLHNYIPLVPAILYTYLIFPMWHKSNYGIETFSIRIIYGWAHLFAVLDTIFKRNLEWNPTGSQHTSSSHYNAFRLLVIFYSMGTALFWISGALWHMIFWNFWNFLPVLISGVLYFLAVLLIVRASYGRIGRAKNRAQRFSAKTATG
jgi:cellulose synthase (UDP-forming)